MKFFKRMNLLIEKIQKNDPAAKGKIFILFFYSGLRAIFFHRIAHWFYKKNLRFIAELVSKRARFKTQIEIHPGAKIGCGVFIDHGCGAKILGPITIGEGSKIGAGSCCFEKCS